MVDILGFASTVIAVAVWTLIALCEYYKIGNSYAKLFEYHGWVIPSAVISTAISAGWFFYG